MKIAVADLRPNPFRDLKRYPIDDAKVDALVASIKDTSFWDNLIARKSPDDNGSYELAYGVHRLRALKKAGETEIDIPIRKLDDETMIKVMVHENQTEWATAAIANQESIRTIIQAFAEDKIQLPKPPPRCPDGNLRYAPGFSRSKSNSNDEDVRETSRAHPYTALTLAEFLGGAKAGWSEDKIKVILETLATIESGLIEQETLEGLTTYQAHQVAVQTRRAAKETGKSQIAKAVGRRLAAGLRSATGKKPGKGGGTGQSITYHGAREATNRMIGKHLPKKKKLPEVGRWADDYSGQLLKTLPSPATIKKVESLIAVKDEVKREHIRHLAGALRAIAKRFEKLADRLEG